MDAQYDMQAHGEQIRHAQHLADMAHESKLDDALNLAHISLAEMETSDVSDMIANDPALDERMSILLERVVLLGVAGKASEQYEQDVIRAARDLHSALVGAVGDRNYREVLK